MTSNLSVLFKKYSVPVLFLMFGIMLMIIAMIKDQDGMFMLASVMMFIAGGLSTIYSSGNLKSTLVYIFGVMAALAGGYALLASWFSVKHTITYQDNFRQCEALSRQNLEDVRFIQKKYQEKNGKYLGSWEELIDFAANGTIPYVKSEGTVPGRRISIEERAFLYNDNRAIDNNMTEEEAYRLSMWTEGPNWENDFKGFVRDTQQVSLMKMKFMSKSYVTGRDKAGFYEFSPDSLPYIPFTNQKKKWTIETVDSIAIGDLVVPGIKISGRIPFPGKDGKDKEIFFGSLTSSDLTGSWEAE